MPRRVDDYRGLTQKSRLRLLHAVQRSPGRRLQELADEAGLPVNTARDHLWVLENEGLITSAPAETGHRGRPPHVYSPVQRAEHSPVARKRVLEAKARGDILRNLEPELDHSGSLGIEAVHQLDTLYEHLEDAGMEPEIDEDELTVALRPCLYEGMLDAERPTICSVHARLVRDQLEQASGPLELRRLHPFVSSERCMLVLGRQGEETRSSRAGGIDADCSDSELEQHALRARRFLPAAEEDPEEGSEGDEGLHASTSGGPRM